MLDSRNRSENDLGQTVTRSKDRRGQIGKRRRQSVHMLERLEERTLLSFTPIAQPGDTLPNAVVYTAGTTNLAGSIGIDGSTTTSLTDGTETVTFSQTMTAATVPAGGWSNWGSPPATETATPRVLFNATTDTVTMTLSKPADVFGFEAQADSFGTFNLTATFFEGATSVGSIPITGVVTPGAPINPATDGAVLFAAATNQAFTSVVLTNTTGGGAGLGIAEVRYNLASATLGLTKTASLSQVLPGNDVTYTIGLTNSGPDDALGTTVTDPLPAGTNFQGDTAPAGWTVAAPPVGSGGTVTFTDTNPFAAGSSATFTIIAQVDPGVPAGTTITNTATGASVDSNSPSASASFTVGGPLTGTSGNEITGVEGSSTGTVLLGTFVDADQSSTAATYTTPPGSVVVNWGDGSAPQTLAASNLTSIGTPNGVVWEISAAHTYTEEDTYAYTVTVTAIDGAATVVNGSAIISDAALAAGAATLLAPHTGVPLPAATVVATFTDANTFATTADYTTTIDWGDGSPQSTGTVVATATPGVFDVEGPHTYAKPGVFVTLVTVHDDGGMSVVVAGSATVTDQAVSGATDNFTTQEGRDTGLFVLATYTDPNTLATVANENATLAVGGWGDTTPTVAGVTLVVQQIGVTPLNSATNPGAPIFEVLGSHDYKEETPPGLPDTLSVIITTLDGVHTTTLTSPPGGGVTVLDAPLTSSNGTEITGVEGTATPATTVIGTFTDANPQAPQGSSSVDDFLPLPAPGNGGSIVVNWGDGTPAETLTAANIAVSGSNNGALYTLTDAHDYTEEGVYAYTIVVTDDGGATTTISGSAIIADAALTAAPVQPVVNADEPTTFPTPEFGGAPSNNLGQLFAGPVATFTDANPLPPTGSSSIADFTATIDWGDGTPLTAGTIVALLGGSSYEVTGTHTYATSGVNGGVGNYPIQVFVIDDGGSKLTIDNTATVTDNPITVTGTINPLSVSGLSTGTADVTNVTQPDFFGTVSATLPDSTTVAEPYATVTLFATNSAGTTFQIGQVEAGSDGSWNIKSTVVLPDDTYTFSANAIDQFGQTTVTDDPITIDAAGDPLTVDTTGPIITGAFFNRLNGEVDFTIQDPTPASGSAPSGVWVNTLLDSSNYLFTKVHANKAYPGKWIVTNVDVTPDATLPNAYDVAVTINSGKPIKGGFYLFTIRDSSNGNSSVQDLAENHLDGVFYGSFPSGNGINGSDFVAELDGFHNKIFAPQTIIGTASNANGGVGGPPVGAVHSGHFTPIVPRGGGSVFGTDPKHLKNTPVKKVVAPKPAVKRTLAKPKAAVKVATGATNVSRPTTNAKAVDHAIEALAVETKKAKRAN